MSEQQTPGRILRQLSRKIVVPMAFIGIIGLFTMLIGQDSDRMKDRLKIAHVDGDFEITELENPNWDRAEKINVTTYWSGRPAPESRRFTALLLWSGKALYVRFDITQAEPLVVSDHPDLSKKTKGLWERDVCEIFIGPEASTPNRYFEFEIAPTGEWIDLGIEVLPEKRVTNWDYMSGMKSAARIEKGKVVMAIKVDWNSLGKTPKAGDRWRGNLFRCVGTGPDRGYLAWQPTRTREPAFHVPTRFGWFEFAK